MSIIIFGATGMLGKYVSRYLKLRGYSTLEMTRAEFDIYSEYKNKTIVSSLEKMVVRVAASFKFGPPSRPYIFNCAGITNKIKSLTEELYAVNAYFPVVLSRLCGKYGVGFIHASTDCVFSGEKGGYRCEDVPDCVDPEGSEYGLSKFLGEQQPASSCVIRTSIIGVTEDGNSGGLLDWVRKQKECDGYTNHFWNGVTCLQYAKMAEQVMRTDTTGLKQLASETVSKYELLRIIDEAYNLNTKINPVEHKIKKDRTLISSFSAQPSLKAQIYEQMRFDENVFYLESNYKIYGKIVVLVTSAINSSVQSIFNPHERLMQTLETSASIRKYIPEAKIVLMEYSKVDDDTIDSLAAWYDTVILCDDDKNVRNCDGLYNKSTGEAVMTARLFRNLSDECETVYKLSGRYYFTAEFDLKKLDPEKINFLLADKCYHTTFYSVPKKYIGEMRDVFSKISRCITSRMEEFFTLVNFAYCPQYWTDIEHSIYDSISSDKINLLEKLNCRGLYSGNGELYDF